MSKAIIDTRLVVGTALACALAMSGTAATAADAEKCYGVVKAGKNDCQTANNACSGHSTADGQKDAWVLLPKGACEKLVGGSLTKP